MKAKELLKKYHACTDAIESVGEKTIEESWNTCERGDWMIWIYSRLYPKNIRELALAKGHFANTIRHLIKDERSIRAVDAAIDFGNGLIEIDDLKIAYAAAEAADADAAYAAAAAAYAAAEAADAAAAYAAEAAAYAAYAAAAYAADAAAAAYAAADADAAYAAADAAADAAYAAAAAAYAADADDADAAAAARKQNQLETANICRKYLKFDII